MIPQQAFATSFFTLLAEAFGVTDAEHGYFLDNGQSGLLGTIATLSAERASQRRSADDSSIAAHCGHVLFLLRFFAAFERGEQPDADWPGSWKTQTVNAAEWAQLQQELRDAYQTVVTRMQARTAWPEPAIGACMLLVTHCAYHVGEIRQRLLWVAE
ncbi:MAG TPA: DinB family protein [Roseiflexaceae bacterium]|nr:DinB family protein [Roseiflexaceae bacterium]